MKEEFTNKYIERNTVGGDRGGKMVLHFKRNISRKIWKAKEESESESK